MFTKIMFFMQLVSDQERALDFYTKLGFEKRIDVTRPDSRFLTMGYKGQNVELLLWKGDSIQPGNSAEAPAVADPGSLFIESEDLRRDFELLVSEGVKFIEKEPEDY